MKRRERRGGRLARWAWALAVVAALAAGLAAGPRLQEIVSEISARVHAVVPFGDAGEPEAGGSSTTFAAHAPEEGATEGRGGATSLPVAVIGGRTTLRLDPRVQEDSGLRVQILEAVTFSPRLTAAARVVDLQPLLAQRARLASMRAQAEVARAGLAAAKAEYDRLSALRREEGDVALKRLQQAEADWKRGEAELARFEGEIAAIREETRQQWGVALAGLALERDSPTFQRLLDRRDVLLLVTLPPGARLPPRTETIQVGRTGEAGSQPAVFVSPAPATDPVIQGETYYFQAAAGGLRAGMNLDAWIEIPERAGVGVIVPQSAVVWAMGRAWAYVKTDDEHFVRRPVATAVEAPGGWFVQDEVKPGEALVVAGAQMLYAEEFRWQIRDEDED